MSETLALAPVTKSVHVGCDVERAFRVFTREIGSWWPLSRYSIHGEDATRVVWEEHEGGEVYEFANGDQRAHWARVVAWQPPSRLVIAWHVNPDTPEPTEVEVRFTPDGDGTRVDLEHRHWERAGAGAAGMRDGYDGGWNTVIDAYAESLG